MAAVTCDKRSPRPLPEIDSVFIAPPQKTPCPPTSPCACPLGKPRTSPTPSCIGTCQGHPGNGTSTAENAKEFINSIFGEERYDLSRVGRYRFNHRFNKNLSEKDLDRRTLSLDDLVDIVINIAELNADPEALPDTAGEI